MVQSVTGRNLTHMDLVTMSVSQNDLPRVFDLPVEVSVAASGYGSPPDPTFAYRFVDLGEKTFQLIFRFRTLSHNSNDTTGYTECGPLLSHLTESVAS